MNPLPMTPAAIAQLSPQALALSGYWTARGVGAIEPQLDALSLPAKSEMVIDAAHVAALDTAGTWILQKLLRRLHDEGSAVTLRGLRPECAILLDAVGQQATDQPDTLAALASAPLSKLEGLGQRAGVACAQTLALLSFVGESASALAGCITHPARLRWRPILFNIRSAGFDALPIRRGPNAGLILFAKTYAESTRSSEMVARYIVCDRRHESLYSHSVLCEHHAAVSALAQPSCLH